ncbi:Hypp6155 [Branchiostoma lanceolatum]|uniref:Hypp6155 protein n=1 Tax=Branchiostoma lanceolatum TaxID=7740 RepID=A0A8J9YQ39_BRALA|nr:Hypp6155 [Branchiostoma lanceolatum]
MRGLRPCPPHRACHHRTRQQHRREDREAGETAPRPGSQGGWCLRRLRVQCHRIQQLEGQGLPVLRPLTPPSPHHSRHSRLSQARQDRTLPPRLAEETGEGGSGVGGAAVPVAPPTNPFLIEAVNIAKWDGTDVETEDRENRLKETVTNPQTAISTSLLEWLVMSTLEAQVSVEAFCRILRYQNHLHLSYSENVGRQAGMPAVWVISPDLQLGSDGMGVEEESQYMWDMKRPPQHLISFEEIGP